MVCAEPRGGKGSAREERGLRSSQGSLSAEPGECNLQMQPRHGITSVRVPGTSQTYAWLPDPPVTATRSPPAIPASPPHTHAHTHTPPTPPHHQTRLSLHWSARGSERGPPASQLGLPNPCRIAHSSFTADRSPQSLVIYMGFTASPPWTGSSSGQTLTSCSLLIPRTSASSGLLVECTIV